jgi:periplasmic protein TonB
MQLALVLSVGVHAALLTVRIVDPRQFERLLADSPLEVVLVNTRGNEAPAQAQALAQANLAGGGDASEGMASSPLPPQRMSALGDQLEEEQRKQSALMHEQVALMSQIRQQIARLSSVVPNKTNDADQTHLEDKRRQLMDLMAAIEKRIHDQNAKPKKRYISPATREVPYAMYYDGMRRKIEEKGTQNFPSANGKKLYGQLMISITVDRQGRVLHAQVDESSGQAVLDRQALSIVQAAAPFGSFTSGMALNEQLVVVAQFSFTRDETLETQLKLPL